MSLLDQVQKFRVISAEGLDPQPGAEPIVLFNEDGSPLEFGGTSFAHLVEHETFGKLISDWSLRIIGDNSPRQLELVNEAGDGQGWFFQTNGSSEHYSWSSTGDVDALRFWRDHGNGSRADFAIQANGTLRWSSGAELPDTSLRRRGAGGLETDRAFYVQTDELTFTRVDSGGVMMSENGNSANIYVDEDGDLAISLAGNSGKIAIQP